MSSVLSGFPLLSELTDENRTALEGAVTIRADGQNVSELGPGEVLGALSLVSIGRRECDAVCAAPTRVMSLTRERYLRLREDLPSLALCLQEAVLRSFASLVRGAVGDSRAAAPAVS